MYLPMPSSCCAVSPSAIASSTAGLPCAGTLAIATTPVDASCGAISWSWLAGAPTKTRSGDSARSFLASWMNVVDDSLYF